MGQLAPLFLVDSKFPCSSFGPVFASYGSRGGKGSFPQSWLGTGCGGRGAIDVKVRRLGLGLCGKNSKGTGHYLWGFLHQIIAEKNF
jgi:hypothetical protein